MECKKKFRPDPNLKLMDQVSEVMRYYHYAYRTEQTYCDWIKRYLKFYEYKKHPKDMGSADVERYLSHLATVGKVAASTQRQALNAIVFLYRDVLDIEIGEIGHIRSKRRLRTKDIDFENELIFVRSGKGDKDRTTLLAKSAIPPLREHIEKVRVLHKEDLEAGWAEVFLPDALSRKYKNAASQFGWYWLFPSKNPSTDPLQLSLRIIRALKLFSARLQQV